MSCDGSSGPATLLTGWGRTAATSAVVARPRSASELLAFLGEFPSRGAIARGLGRSYGDSAQNAGGLVVDMTSMNRLRSLDVASGLARVEAGASIDELARMLLPLGWFLPVTPGTRFVTVGGAIAADVHGKNHHHDGSFGRHVESMTLALADGTRREISPEQDPELHWATIGGMGLTGVIIEATIRLLPVPSAWMLVNTKRGGDLEAVLRALASADQHRYSVAWIDLLATGRRSGRGIVTSAEHAPLKSLPDRARAKGRELAPASRLKAPSWAPPLLLNRMTIGAFNEAWFHRAPPSRVREVQSLGTYFHPLDGIDRWNRLYGRRGLVQYQCVVPDEEGLRLVLKLVQAARLPTFLAVLKRFGASNPGPLSFPRPGWTLAFDTPAATRELDVALDRLDGLVASLGGSVYLAKDSRLRPELLPVFYPRLKSWLALRDRVDPHRVFVSDQSRRLSL
jgi:decaprenylphospho-beta-D-ribofuranose 2-oxidase